MWRDEVMNPGHSIYIGNYNTWTTWHLFPTTRPYIEPAEPKLKIDDADALKNNVIDASNVLSGNIFYNDREGSWEFKFIETYPNAWKDVYYDIYNKLNGVYYDYISLEDDLAYYYSGRLTIESWENNQQDTTVKIRYRLRPIATRSSYSVVIHNDITGKDERIDNIRRIERGTDGTITIYRNDGSVIVRNKDNTIKERNYYKDTVKYGDWLWNDLFNNRIYYGKFHVKGSKWRTLLQAADGVHFASATCENTMTVKSDFFGDVILAPGENPNRIPLEFGKDTLMQFIGNGDVTINYLIKE